MSPVPLCLDLSGIGIVLHGMPAALADRVTDEFAGFLGAGADPLLRIDVVAGAGGTSPGAAFDPKSMRAELGPRRAVFSMPEGSATVEVGGDARIELSPDLGRREFYTLMNLVRACLAWRLPGRGGALLHAACLVVDRRAFVLVGPEGAGKTTWARLGAEGGALAVSDDVVIVDASAAGPVAIGAPLRSTLRTHVVRGRWPVAAILLPRHGSPPRSEPASRLITTARLAANLPFVAGGIEHDPRIARVLERLAALPAAEFWFAPEGSFLDVLRAWPAER